MASRSILRTTLLLLPFQIVFRAGDALLPLLLAAWFGRSSATDVYYFSWAAFYFAGSLIFSAYQDSAVVPILSEVKLKTPDLLATVRGSLLSHTLLIGSALAVAVGLAATLWFWIRFNPADFALAASMTAPFCVYLIALCLKTFFSALLNAEHKYFAYPVASSMGIASTIAFLAAARGSLGVLAIPVALLVGEFVAAAALAWACVHICRMQFVFTLARPQPVVQFARLVASEVGGGAVTRINPVIDQLMAGLAGVIGGGTLLRYSGDVASLPTSLLQATLLPVLLSHAADTHSRGDGPRVRTMITRSLVASCAVITLLAAALFAVREPLLRFVFLRGEMDPAGVERMIKLLPYHLVGLPAFGALLVLARAHVALKNSRIMIPMGIFNAVANAVFNVVLLQWLGLEGIALSTSLVYVAVAIAFWVQLQKRLRHEEGPR